MSLENPKNENSGIETSGDNLPSKTETVEVSLNKNHEQHESNCLSKEQQESFVREIERGLIRENIFLASRTTDNINDTWIDDDFFGKLENIENTLQEVTQVIESNTSDLKTLIEKLSSIPIEIQELSPQTEIDTEWDIHVHTLGDVCKLQTIIKSLQK